MAQTHASWRRGWQRALWSVVWTTVTAAGLASADDWVQFRGVGGAGVAAKGSYPTEIGPTQNVLWKTPLPPGHSSPVLAGDRIFVTAVRDQKLLTIGLDRATGKVLWEAESPVTKVEKIHGIGSLAQPTPVTDGQRVISFFGSSGLVCHDRDGKELWRIPMGPFNNDFGAGTSPILVDNMVLLCQDHDTDSFLMAVDKRTGKTIWKTDRSEFPRNYCSPVIWEANGKRQIVIAATLRVVGYDLETGRELWTVRGISRTVCMTPVIGGDGNLYLAGWAAGGDSDEPIRLAPFSETVQHDANKNGKIEDAELPKGDVKQRFSQIDRNNDESIDEQEYEFFRSLFEQGKNVVMAIKPGAKGEATDTHVLWTQNKFVPFCSSPLYYQGLVYTVKDGGIVNCIDATSGKIKKTGRLPKSDDYYASPVAGDGKIYFANQAGQLTVINADAAWKPLHTADFEEEIYATPALVDGRIYLRTNGHLFCFGP